MYEHVSFIKLYEKGNIIIFIIALQFVQYEIISAYVVFLQWIEP